MGGLLKSRQSEGVLPAEQPREERLSEWQVERATDALCALAASGSTGLSIEQTGTALAKALSDLNQFCRCG